MKIFRLLGIPILSLLVMASCHNNTDIHNSTSDSISATPTTEPAAPPSKENYCFLSTLKRDSTFVNLTIEGDSVTGNMHWKPFEKDGSIGTLAGKKNNLGEFELLYDYMIEGNRQTETKVMKIENGKLVVKVGELLDSGNNGHLVYKDVATATYKDTLNQVDCK